MLNSTWLVLHFSYAGDGGPATATNMRMYQPSAVASDGAGGVLTVEIFSNSVRRIYANGTIVGVVGNNCWNFSNFGMFCSKISFLSNDA